MNLKSTIRCTLLFLIRADANQELPWSAISFLGLDSGFNAIPEPIASGEPNPGKPACPIGNRGFVKCSEDYEPVLCDGVCVYDNLCSAQAGPGFTEEDCEKVIEPEDQPNPGKSTFPKSDLTGDGCHEIYTPVSCDDCIYANICFPKAAGFLENYCEKVMGQEDVPNDPLPVNPTQITVGQPTDIEEPIEINPETPGMEIPGFPPVSSITETKEASSAYRANDTPGMIIPSPGGPVASSGTNESEEASSGTNDSSSIAIGEYYPAIPCRIGDSGIVPCPLIFAPVVCGGLCKYDNF
jgi:hypothetical protein